jgi:hypothetical protein
MALLVGAYAPRHVRGRGRPQGPRILDCALANVSCRRDSPIAARPGEGRFTQPKAATQAGRGELVFMPQSCP